MQLIMSIDTEADNQWEYSDQVQIKNIAYCQRFQALCEKYAIKPTYLITSEVATDPNASIFFRDLVENGKAEVGAHLHPWTTPPFNDEPGLRYNDPLRAFPSELPFDLLDKKLETLTLQIKKSTGVQPTSYRAGRFGFSLDQAKLLKQYGYLVDSSVTPLTNWGKTKGVTAHDFFRKTVL
jgi:hypothetical protein